MHFISTLEVLEPATSFTFTRRLHILAITFLTTTQLPNPLTHFILHSLN